MDRAPDGPLACVSREQLRAATEALSKEATKVGMLCKAAPVPETLIPLLEALEFRAIVLLALGQALVRAGVGAGPTFFSAITAAMGPVAQSCSRLLLAVKAHDGGLSASRSSGGKARGGVAGDDEDAIARLVGVVWDACDGIKKLPLSNNVAVGRVITRAAMSVKSALAEMEGMRASESQGGAAEACRAPGEVRKGTGEAAGHGSDDSISLPPDGAAPVAATAAAPPWAGSPGTPERGGSEQGGAGGRANMDEDGGDNDDDDDFEPEFLAEDIAAVAQAIELVKAVAAVYRPLMLAVQDAEIGCQEHIAALEAVGAHVKGVAKGVDALGAALYPPQERGEIDAAVAEVLGALLGTRPHLQALFSQVPRELVDTLDDAVACLMRPG